MKNAELESIRRDYLRDGFAIVKSLFTADEISNFREKIASMPNRQGDILSHKILHPILLDDRVIRTVKAALNDDIIYFGDSVIRYEMTENTRGFHQDSQQDYEDPQLTDYTVLRIGIYMQDHKYHSGGLKVRRGSHRHIFPSRINLKRFLSGKYRLSGLRLGRSMNLEIEPGDLVLWNLRTWHSGYAVRLKWFPSLSLNPVLERKISDSMAIPDIRPRTVLFASFGAASPTFESYLRDRITHPSTTEHWQVSKFDSPAAIVACKKAGVKLRFDGLKKRKS